MPAGEHPFDQDSNLPDLFRQIISGAYTFRPEIWDEISGEAQDLVRRMMTVDPRRRITAAGCLAHPWCARYREGKASTLALTNAQVRTALRRNPAPTSTGPVLGTRRSRGSRQ